MSLLLSALLLAPVDLDAVLRFSRPAACEMDAPLRAIVERMVRQDPETFEALPPPPVAVPGFPEPITPRFTRTRTVEGNADIREVTIELAIPGRWHGLDVTRLLRRFGEESDSSSLEIQFAEPPPRVHAALRRAGFRLGPVGTWRETETGDGIGVSVLVSRIEGGASLVCAIG
ncbi:MAG TPA: hypothetical protein VGW40_07710 [Allosphingosinicella sp.]|nr:hypothetical protein [Allosphingosinicella sp.]